MSLGEIASIAITSDYGYGGSGHGDAIPPDSDLNFEVQLLSIRSQQLSNRSEPEQNIPPPTEVLCPLLAEMFHGCIFEKKNRDFVSIRMLKAMTMMTTIVLRRAVTTGQKTTFTRKNLVPQV
eukprot:SAG31_NODE_2743_length_5152_cov_2.442905_4_plen_122_part_00